VKIGFKSAQNLLSTILTLASLQRQQLVLRPQTFAFVVVSLREEWWRKNLGFALSEANFQIPHINDK
jgi:hypothetical protein